MRTIACMLALVILTGCASHFVGSYSMPFVGKNPWVLQINRDNTYVWQQFYGPDKGDETGRWWKVTDTIILLLPDEFTKPHRFARLERTRTFSNVRISENYRELADSGSQQPAAHVQGGRGMTSAE